MAGSQLGRLTTGLILVGGFGMVAAVVGVSSWLFGDERPPRPAILPLISVPGSSQSGETGTSGWHVTVRIAERSLGDREPGRSGNLVIRDGYAASTG